MEREEGVDGGAASCLQTPFPGGVHMVFPESHIEPSNTSSSFPDGGDPPSPCGWPRPQLGSHLLGVQAWGAGRGHAGSPPSPPRETLPSCPLGF